MLNLESRREIRKLALNRIAQMGPTSPQDIAVKLLQILQKNNPRNIADSKALIEVYLDYYNRIMGTENQEAEAANRRRVLTALKAIPAPSEWKPLTKYALQYNYDSKDVQVNQDLAKLAVRVLSTFMRTANILSAAEIAQAYQKIYTSILNSVVPRYH